MVFENETIEECEYNFTVLDFRPPVDCQNETICELNWPCELRRTWVDLHDFIVLTRWFLCTGTISLIIIGTILNGLCFYIIISSGISKQGSGVYLIALTLSDTGNLLVNFAVGIGREQSYSFNYLFMDNEWLCRFHGVFVEIFHLLTAWIVVGFTVERCVAVWFPMLWRPSSSHRSKFTKCFIFILIIISSLFSFSKLFLKGFENDSVFGYEPCKSNRKLWEVFEYVRIAVETWLPTIFIFTFNILMFYKLNSVQKMRIRLTEFHGPRRENSNEPLAQRMSPASPMLIAVSLAYLILVFPLGAVQSLELYWNWKMKIPPSSLQPQKSLYIQWMQTKILLKSVRSFLFGFYQMNFSLNFFLYFLSGRQFRSHLVQKVRVLQRSILSQGSRSSLPEQNLSAPRCFHNLPSQNENNNNNNVNALELVKSH